ALPPAPDSESPFLHPQPGYNGRPIARRALRPARAPTPRPPADAGWRAARRLGLPAQPHGSDHAETDSLPESHLHSRPRAALGHTTPAPRRPPSSAGLPPLAAVSLTLPDLPPRQPRAALARQGAVRPPAV